MARQARQASPGRVALLFASFAVVHSLLASRQAKTLARRGVGARERNGFYRAGYILQSLVSFAAGAWVFLRLPDRRLYRVKRPWSWAMVAGQLAGLGLTVSGALAVGFTRITGIRSLLQALSTPVPPPEPEAQGPRLGPDGEMLARGPFRFTRHPANWGFIPVFLLIPHMTVNRAALAVLATLYLIAGSVHEEARLLSAYGAAYQRYQRAVPFLLGIPRRTRNRPDTRQASSLAATATPQR
jgi:protein-S-isoprenylcysteine O-methyltransferase Ste14